MSATDEQLEPVGVVGVGWVGLVTAACFASRGHQVWAMDVDAAKVAKLSSGEVTFHEPGLGELVVKHADRLHFTTSMDELLANARLLFCCVDTPPTYSGDADLSRVKSVVDRLPSDADHALVMKSTVPSGTGESIRRDMPALSYVSCPEFLKEGSAVDDFLNPDRVVIGADEGDEWAADAVAGLYEPLGGEIVRTDVASAEMIKLASNAFLATKISFINEIANVCEEVGADVTEVARGMGLDERIGSAFLKAGIGYGGSCLVGAETVLVRRDKQVGEVRLDHLFDSLCGDGNPPSGAGRVSSPGIHVLARRDDGSLAFSPVSAMTARGYEGEVIEISTAAGARLTATADHPFAVLDPDDQSAPAGLSLASELTIGAWLPIVTAAVQQREPISAVLARDGRNRLGEPVSDISETGFRTGQAGTSAIRVTGLERRHFCGRVFSIEIPSPHQFVSTGGLVTHNCFPKDVSALKQLAGNSGYHFQLLNSVIEVNELQKRRVIGKLTKHLGSLVGKRIALLGLAFKPNTDDMREATSLVLSARLQGEGATVVAYDPVATEAAAGMLTSTEFATSAAAALEGVDGAILVTEWPEFADLDWPALAPTMKAAVLVDGRNFLDPEAMRAAGFTYESIGR
jgi:UDP-glucose 6-dehydrogenase